MKKLPKVNTSKLLKAALPYILIGLMATKLGQAYRMTSGGDVLDRVLGVFLKVGEAFANPLPSLHPFDLLVGTACGALLWFIVYQKSKNARKYRRGAEYGTARWGNCLQNLLFFALVYCIPLLPKRIVPFKKVHSCSALSGMILLT